MSPHPVSAPRRPAAHTRRRPVPAVHTDLRVLATGAARATAGRPFATTRPSPPSSPAASPGGRRPGFTGGGYLSGFTAPGARAVFSVNAPPPTAIRSPSATAPPARTPPPPRSSPTAPRTAARPPGTSGAWATVTADADLRAGLNTLTLRTGPEDDGAFQLDGIGVTGAVADSPGRDPPVHRVRGGGRHHQRLDARPRPHVPQARLRGVGREAVVLEETGDYVEFELTEPANALTLRYSIPDSASGTGIQAPLSVYADGEHISDLDLTSEYSWVYGAYPYTNDPAQGSGHHFFDETHARVGDLPPVRS
ncbi:hypothetical protein NKH77_05020 [Streptomyces sp. M19]